jgi:hypothetical protein
MKGAPVVGSGLGGLPRRSAAAAASVATVNSRYDLQHVEVFTTTSMPTNVSTQSLPILMNGKGLQYFTDQTPWLRRNQFDYSSAGVANQTSTTISASTNITQLPVAASPQSGDRNCVWSHQVSSTQTLFKYTRLLPFLVTWDGVNDSSYIFPTAPVDITLSNESDAFILPNGNLVVFGNQTSNQNLLRLVEYTPSLTFVRTFNIGTGNNLGDVQVAARLTSYGYVVGFMSTTSGTNAACFAATLNNTCTAVISTRTSTLQMTSANPSTMQSIICGEEGIVFSSFGNSGAIFGSINMPISSAGVIASVLATQYYGMANITVGSAFTVNSLVGTMPSGVGCNKFATALAPGMYVDSNGNPRNKAVLFSSASGSSGRPVIGYIDFNMTPIFNSSPIQDSSTIWAAHINTQTNAVYYYVIGADASSNMAFDENGFVWINYRGAFQSNRLFRRVPRA